MLAVADTGPLHYLVLIEHVRALESMFSEVAIPGAVHEELAHRNAPAPVRRWIASPPAWLSVVASEPGVSDRGAAELDRGEREALALAVSLRPALLLMDDRAGIAAARATGFAVTGTLGLLVRAARRGLLDLPAAFERLGRTNFRWTPSLRARLLSENPSGRR